MKFWPEVIFPTPKPNFLKKSRIVHYEKHFFEKVDHLQEEIE